MDRQHLHHVRANRKNLAQSLLGRFVQQSTASNNPPGHPESQPYFQRTYVTKNALKPSDETLTAYQRLANCMGIRRAYILKSRQYFPVQIDMIMTLAEKGASLEQIMGEFHLRPKGVNPIAGGIKQMEISSSTLPNLDYKCEMVKGVVRVSDKSGNVQNFTYPAFEQHVEDLQRVWRMAIDGPVRSHCTSRLEFLRSKFDIHTNLNGVAEDAEQEHIPNRDFYNVLKVDTHIHAAACMTTRDLLGRIEKAAKEEPNQPVLPGKQPGDPPITLKQLFEQLKLDPFKMSVDSMDVHADSTTMQRFDRFDQLYNIAGESLLRKVFLKPTKNLVRGRYFAEMIKTSLDRRGNENAQYSELRISGGGNIAEWTDLAKWAKENKLNCAQNQWVIQIPRSYPSDFKSNSAKNFEEFMAQTFLPMFLATSDPQKYPEIAEFLEQVCALDSVSDESVDEIPILTKDLPTPDQWATAENPSYAYYMYYMYANLTVLNQFRERRGLNVLKLRPHCGESGSAAHLASAFILAENISHGIQLEQNSSLEYLYYLAQIPIAMSPLSNNALFLPYLKHPLKKFFAEGIPVTVSTDDPLMFHLTSEPLAEEYAVASQVFSLSTIDQCEIARNSVVMCGFPERVKAHWIGENYKEPGINGNEMALTNVPDVRFAYRYETHCGELYNLLKGLDGHH